MIPERIYLSSVQYDPLMMSPSNSVFLQSEDGAGANKDGEGTGTLLYDTMQYYKKRVTYRAFPSVHAPFVL